MFTAVPCNGLGGAVQSSTGYAKVQAVVRAALAGNVTSGTVLLAPEVLAREGADLAERALISLVPTERAMPTIRAREQWGMVLEAAVPILDSSGHVAGAVYGGILTNNRFDLVDRIRDTVFGDKTYQGRPVGTVTLFLDDVRVATNVTLDSGARAVGTRVSRAVYEKVLDRGQRFADRAFVVNDSCAIEIVSGLAAKVRGPIS